ncbi:MAG: AAA family ATPase [Actinobacteria bacterium]|nr:AAA family ATPase [Actinomycetota bacterium]
MADAELVGRAELVRGLVDRADRGGGFVLTGPAGVGKSRVLHEVATRLASGDVHVAEVFATRAARTVPFSPFLGVLTGDAPPEGPLQILQAIRRALLRAADGRRLCISVDDAHLLDDGSLATVATLARDGDVVLALTVRTDEETPPAITDLWAADLVRRFDLLPLDDRSANAVAERILGGPMAEELAATVLALGRGNPLLIRELVLDARACGSVAVADGRWVEAEPLRPGPRLVELLDARLARLPDDEREVLEMIAFGEPIVLQRLGSDLGRCVDRLEERELVRARVDAGDVVVACEHPLIGECLRVGTPTTRRVEVVRRLLRHHGAGDRLRPGEARRVADWCEDVGDPVPARIADASAREAMSALDLDAAEELASTAVAGEDRWEHRLTLAEVLHLRGRPRDADAALVRAHEMVVDDEGDVRVTSARARLLAHQLGRPDLAAEVVAEAAVRIGNPALRFELERTLATLAAMNGDFEELARASAHVLADDRLDPASRRDAVNQLAYARVMLGDPTDIDALLDESVRTAGRDDGGAWMDVLETLRAGARIQRGEIDLAARAVGEQVRRRRERNEPTGALGPVLLELLLMQGSSDTIDQVEATIDELEHADPHGVPSIARGISACALAQAGRIAEAGAMVDLIPAADGDVRSKLFVARGRAAITAAHGDPGRAARIVADAGRDALDAGHVAFSIPVLHHAVRFGRADLVAAPMSAAVRDPDATLLVLMAEDAAAEREGDPDRLTAVAEDFAAVGAPLMADDALARSLTLLPSDAPTARIADARRRVLAARVRPLCTARGPAVAEALTDRELAASVEAAGGATSREIAERAFVSRRTIENHLGRAYRKLQVDGRPGLTAALGAFVGGPRSGAC